MRVQTNFLGVQAIAKLEGTVSKCALTSTPTARVGYYKTTHRLNNPLEGLSELPERSYPHSYSLLQRRKQEHPPRGEADRVEYRQVSNMGLPLFSLCVPLLPIVGDNMHSVVNKGSSPKSQCSEILLGLHYVVKLIDYSHG